MSDIKIEDVINSLEEIADSKGGSIDNSDILSVVPAEKLNHNLYDEIIEKINGDNTMPRTVVLNKKGEIVYNEQRSVTLEMLEQLLRTAQEDP